MVCSGGNSDCRRTNQMGEMIMDKAQRIIEVQRVVNLVRGFGWELETIREDSTSLQITIMKAVTPEGSPE